MNELEVARSLEREGAMLSVNGEGNCRYGLLSVAEKETVLSGLVETHPGHLVDVEGTRMTIRGRDGRSKDVEIEPGSWLVNCTSHFKYVTWEPVLSDGGLVCAPQYGLGFTGTTAYFLTHLWFRDSLGKIADRLRTGRTDVEPKLRFLCDVGVMVLHNMSLVGEHLPLSVGARFRGDFNKWYPLYRQLPALMRLTAYKKEAIAKGERLLPTRFVDPPP